jgi:hypothetical protein
MLSRGHLQLTHQARPLMELALPIHPKLARRIDERSSVDAANCCAFKGCSLAKIQPRLAHPGPPLRSGHVGRGLARVGPPRRGTSASGSSKLKTGKCSVAIAVAGDRARGCLLCVIEERLRAQARHVVRNRHQIPPGLSRGRRGSAPEPDSQGSARAAATAREVGQRQMAELNLKIENSKRLITARTAIKPLVKSKTKP